MLINEELILENLSLVKIIAHKIKNRYISYLDLDDLVGYGVFGLIDAAQTYDISKSNGKSFKNYACDKIGWAIISGLRSSGVNAKRKKTNLPIYFFDICKNLCDTIENTEESYPDKDWELQFENIETKTEYEKLYNILNSLPEKNKDIIIMYYGQCISLQEIGTKYNVSESRACQLVKESLNKARMQYGLLPIYSDNKYNRKRGARKD